MRRIEVRDVRLLLLAIHFVSLFLIPKFPADMDFRLICPFCLFSGAMSDGQTRRF